MAAIHRSSFKNARKAGFRSMLIRRMVFRGVGTMKKMILLCLLLQTTFLLAAGDKPNPNPANYTLTVHVVCSFVRGQSGNRPDTQRLGVVLDGKQLELTVVNRDDPLAPGDYKARLLKDTSPNVYDIQRAYELLLPDGKVRTYQVSGLGPGTCSSGQ
jgi:hypothetical protein